MDNIFLTSQASNVLKRIAELLPKKPSEYKTIFIPTAANTYAESPWMQRDRDALQELGFKIVDLELDIASPEETRVAVKEADIIFVAGGNTFYLLEKAKKTGFDAAVRAAVSEGKVYIGSSAGSLLAAPDIEFDKVFDDSEKADLSDTQALGIVNFAVMPHVGNPKYAALHEKVLSEYKDWKYPIVSLKDNQFAIPKGESWEIIDV